MRKPIGVIFAWFFVSFCGVATSSTWYVDDAVPSSGDGKSWPTAFKTIQEGINASSDGDTVMVEAGTYLENIQVRGKNIMVQSKDPLVPSVVGGHHH